MACLAGVGVIVAVALVVAGGGGGGKVPGTGGAAGRSRPANVLARVVDTVSTVGNDPEGIATEPGSVWVANYSDNTVSQIEPVSQSDPSSDVSGGADINVGTGPVVVLAASGQVWVANGVSGTVSRINPISRAVVGAPIQIGKAALSMAVFGGSVWVTYSGTNTTITRIDASSGSVLPGLSLGPSCCNTVSAGLGELWVSFGHEVARINASGNVVGGPIKVTGGKVGAGVSVGEGAVWVVQGDGSVIRIDPRSGNPVGSPIPTHIGRYYDIETGLGDVWICDYDKNTVTQIDAATGKVVGTIAVGKNPYAMAVGDGAVWVTNEFDGTVSKIQ